MLRYNKTFGDRDKSEGTKGKENVPLFKKKIESMEE